MKKKSTGLARPFFAGFLESQEKNAVQGGLSLTSRTEDQPQSQKYPSDQEDGHTLPLQDGAQTMKAPSDSDEWL